MKKSFFFIGIAAMFALVIESCTGPAGPIGLPGAAGGSGVSNLSFYHFKLDTNAWGRVMSPDTMYRSILEPVNSIYAGTNPEIEVYYSLGSVTGPWTALPVSGIWYGSLSSSRKSDTLIDQLGYTFYSGSPGYIQFTYNLNQPYTYATKKPKGTVYVLLAVIPPVVMKRHPHTNWQDGNAVMNLPEVKASMAAGNF